jgi:hypothetical protein
MLWFFGEEAEKTQGKKITGGKILITNDQAEKRNCKLL